MRKLMRRISYALRSRRLEAELAEEMDYHRERLQQADFATMTSEEFALAKRLAQSMPLPLSPLVTRRHVPAAAGRPDFRRTMQRSLRAPDSLIPAWSAPRPG